MQFITGGLARDAASLRYASQNWWYHVCMVLSYTKDFEDIILYCGSSTISCLEDPFVWFKYWMVALGGSDEMKRAHDDFRSTIAYITVGQAILNATRLTLMFM
jgi:hypothetical protein